MHITYNPVLLTSLSPCQTEQLGCAATPELVPASLSHSSLLAEGPAQLHELHSTENKRHRRLFLYLQLLLSIE